MTNAHKNHSQNQSCLTSNPGLQMLRSLVEFNTVSDRSNLMLIDFVEAYLHVLGVQSVRLVDPIQNKANLFATIGPDVPGGVILSGHTDVVPTVGQDWSTDPFSMHIEGGKAYGRGTCDMKGFLSSVLAAVPMFLKSALKSPVHLCFSYDEEVGCAGVGSLISYILDNSLEPSTCIVGEPTMMQLVTAHTGKQVFECRFKGTPKHSSLAPNGINAIVQAGQAITKIDQIAGQFSNVKSSDERFIFPHPTVNVGRIEGGQASNIVAAECRFIVECRCPPGVDPSIFTQKLHSAIGQIAADSGVANSSSIHPEVLEVISYPSFTTPDHSSALKFAMGVTGADETLAVNYGTEAGHFSSAGIPTVVVGPGDIAQAHQADEFIELTQLAACDTFLRNIAIKLSSQESME